MLVTGDTDLAPAVKTAKRIFASKEVVFAFPYKRENRELQKLVPRSFKIKKEMYAKHQFPDPYVFPDQSTICKPSEW